MLLIFFFKNLYLLYFYLFICFFLWKLLLGKNTSIKSEGCCSSSDDIIELQDVRMSPIASLRHRSYTCAISTCGTNNSGTLEQADFSQFPPSFRITRNYGGISSLSRHNQTYGLRYRSPNSSNAAAATAAAAKNSNVNQRPKMFHAIRRGARVLRKSIPNIKDVNIIDKYSRMIFPISFLAFNAGYWIFYALE